jgi:hypothetical protein
MTPAEKKADAKKKATAKKAAARKKAARRRARLEAQDLEREAAQADQGAKIGRPTRYDEKYVHQAFRLALLGLDDKQIAGVFGIVPATLYAWRKKYPAFLEALNNGKAMADGQVAVSLYRRAVGYEHDDVQINVLRDGTVVKTAFRKKFAPDTTACIYWLKNRQPDFWRDKEKDDKEPQRDTARELRDALALMNQADGIGAALAELE